METAAGLRGSAAMKSVASRFTGPQTPWDRAASFWTMGGKVAVKTSWMEHSWGTLW